ncbi:hypothetical protein SBA7_880023 [Candidatus Sulfotelmatobacter sp. SbA7]|nr:hypothetical protein SBA7_880023 [Candidatus Sulfotelmatobacter sp. SbA7]
MATIFFKYPRGNRERFDNRGFYPAGEGNGNYCFSVTDSQRFHQDMASKAGIPKPSPVHNFLRLFTLN